MYYMYLPWKTTYNINIYSNVKVVTKNKNDINLRIHYTFTFSPKLSELKSLHHLIVYAEPKYLLLSNLVHAFWVHKINN